MASKRFNRFEVWIDQFSERVEFGVTISVDRFMMVAALQIHFLFWSAGIGYAWYGEKK